MIKPKNHGNPEASFGNRFYSKLRGIKPRLDGIDVVKINVDDNPLVSGKYGVRSIPKLLIIKGGEVKDTTVGLSSKDKLAELINRNLN